MRPVLLAMSFIVLAGTAHAETAEMCLSGFWQASHILQETKPHLSTATSYAEILLRLQEAGSCPSLNEQHYITTNACDFEREELRVPIERMMLDPKRDLKEVEIILAFCRGAGLLPTTCSLGEAP